MKRIFQIIESNKVLFKNFTSLSLLQIANYIFPLITLPYLVRVLGPEKYGLVSFATAFAAYFIIITDYGFNLSATQEISINRNDKERVAEIFSSVITSKLLLYFISTIIFFICLFSFDIFREDSNLFLITYSGLIGTVLFPLWYFQGTENMNSILIINLFIKLIIMILIFLFIKNSADYILLAIIYSVSQVVYGLTGLITVMKKFKVKLFLTNLKNVFNQLRKSKNIFISSLSISAISTSNVFILGLFVDKSTVGYFAAADKIRLAFQSMLSPIFTATFPHVSNLAKKSLEQFYKFNKKSFFFATTFGLLIFLVINLNAEILVKIVLGSKYENSIIILKILSIIPLLYSISNFLGVQILLPLNYSKKYAAIMIFALIVHSSFALILANYFQAIGSSIAIIIAEMITIVLLLLSIMKIKMNYATY
ncbi:MAG: oligosaccharide flippase family protein [Ignavibacterium sp.]|nr:oligosaccharide flippase family protein [Ignavibacterium sp.]